MVLNNDLLQSFYYDKIWDIGRLYEDEIAYSFHHDKLKIGIGYHSYSMDKIVKITAFIDNNLVYHLGCDIYCDSDLNEGETFVLSVCTIPKGSEYYENENGEIVSNKLRIDETFKMSRESYEQLSYYIGRHFSITEFISLLKKIEAYNIWRHRNLEISRYYTDKHNEFFDESSYLMQDCESINKYLVYEDLSFNYED